MRMSLKKNPTPMSTDILGAKPARPASSTARTPSTTEAEAIRHFRINIPEEALIDLRQRVSATRWPDKETVADESEGVPLALRQESARYWATDYDWRTVEAKLNVRTLNFSRRNSVRLSKRCGKPMTAVAREH
jgi:hypothetical protein